MTQATFIQIDIDYFIILLFKRMSIYLTQQQNKIKIIKINLVKENEINSTDMLLRKLGINYISAIT